MDSSLNSYTINSKNPHKCGLLQEALTASRLLKYSPTCGLPPLALALFFRQVSAS